MPGSRCCTLTLVLCALVATEAYAEPSAGYPADVSKRPLVLPTGSVEATSTFRHLGYTSGGDLGLEDYDFSYLDLSLRGGLGAVELFAETDLLLSYPDGGGAFERDTVERIGLGARFPTLANQAVLVAGSYYFYGPDSNALSVDTSYWWRRETGAGVAVRGGVGARYYRSLPPSSEIEDPYVLTAVGMFGGDVRLSDVVGTQLDAGLTVPLSDNSEFYEYQPEAVVGGRLLYMAHAFDAFAGVSWTTSGELVVRSMTVGVRGRLP